MLTIRCNSQICPPKQDTRNPKSKEPVHVLNQKTLPSVYYETPSRRRSKQKKTTMKKEDLRCWKRCSSCFLLYLGPFPKGHEIYSYVTESMAPISPGQHLFWSFLDDGALNTSFLTLQGKDTASYPSLLCHVLRPKLSTESISECHSHLLKPRSSFHFFFCLTLRVS